ncbi:carboxypeptidase-like regulatory domain-containing protein [Stieleria mannarensis]|uniref:carboxypeptidase-like regulatory domain-containing protein n=1 Tax=Stieleria mannarensis TaxID=2755585 RepID=UPI001602E8F5|nr:carboxypeptidase-like regulatory domain-containing protein [Rhodopirellula sp. JC639]
MQPDQQPSWRTAAKKRGHARLARDLRRAAIVIGLLALTVVLILLLFPPFFAPQTHLVLIGSRGNDAFNTPPIPFVAEDLEAIASIREAKVRDQSETLRSAQSAKNLAGRLAETKVNARDNLILYINAHGVTDNATAYLLCDNFDLRQPDLGRISVETLLDQVRQSPAATKLIVINAGTIDYDPGLGVVGNEFPRLLENAVRQTRDPSLWVYCSHSSLQYSHVSRAARRSVFGMFVGEGLKGAADLDHDRTIKLSELVGFTSANVAKWVAQSTDRGAQQSPQLIWGGGQPGKPDPELLTLFERDPTKQLTAASLIVPLDEDDGVSGSSSRSGRIRGLLRRQQVTLASNRIPSGGTTMGSVGAAGNDAGEPSDSAGQAASAGADDESGNADGGADPGDATDTAGPDAGTDGHADGSGKTGDGNENPSGEGVSVKTKQLLSKAWQQRDTASLAWSALDPSLSPIENKPHLWRELQAELLAFEQQLSGGKGYDDEMIEATLEESFPSKPAANTTASRSPTPPLKSLFGGASEETIALLTTLNPDRAHSVALARLAAMIQGRELEVDLGSLQAALEQDQRQAFDEWLKTRWRSEFSGYIEMAFVKRLADDPDLDWGLVQIAALTTLAGERIAALDLLSPGWVRSEVERADQLRFFAEQLVVDRVGLQWQERCESLFQDAGMIYAAAEHDFVEVRRAERQLEVVLARLPSYLHWHRMSRFMPEQRSMFFEDVSALLDLATELSDLLDQPGQSSVATLVTVRRQLESVQSSVEAACGDASAERLLARTPTPGDSHQAHLLLRTPLVSSSLRSQLLAASDQRDRELAANYDLANIGIDDVAAMDQGGADLSPGAEDWQFLFEQAKLESRYVRLSHIPGVEANEFAAVTVAREVDAAFESLEQGYRSMQAAPSGAKVAAVWQSHSKFGTALQAFYRSAAEVERALSSCAVSPAASRMAIRLLRMLDPRDAWQLDRVDVNALSLASQLRSTLRWQASRLVQASTYHTRTVSTTLADWSDQYRTRAELLCRSTDPLSGLHRIDVTAPEQVDLQYGDHDEILVTMENPSDRELSVTVSLEYEARLIDVDLQAGVGARESGSAADTIRPRFFDTPSQFGTRRSQPITIAAESSIALPLKITRRDDASETTKLVVDVYQPSSLTRSDAQPPVLLTRRSIDVMLPVAEVLVRRGDATFVSDVGGVELLPHPNRLETFRFGVVNHASRAKSISMRCYALDVSVSGRLPADPSALLVGALPLASFDLNVPGDGHPAFPSAGEAEPGGENAKGANAADAPKEEPAKKDDAAAEPIQSVDMPHGMLVELNDRETGQSTFRYVRFAIQRPRRFVVPRVGFDTTKQQITIEVSAADPARLPEGAPVRVECRLADDRYGRTKGKLQGMISRSNPTTKLFIATTIPPPRVVRVYIDVDGYPRSFIFDVPCGKHLTNVPEITDRVDLRMATSSKGGVLGATKSIPVAVQIDAPVGSFENGRDHLDLGIDLDASGVPNPEDRVTLTTDRGVMIGFVKSAPDGTIELTNAVSDHLIDLPSQRLENLLIDVAASLTINDKVQSVRSIELLIDTAPPVVGPIHRTDGLDFVAVNGQVDLEVWAWDEGSDVTKVEAAFDLEGTGEFPAAGNIFTGSRTSDRQWVLTVDSGPDAGKKTLLVRGVDRVGNESDPLSIDIEVVSATESAKRVKQQTVDLVGTIQFRERNVPEAEVRLIAVPAEDSGVGAGSSESADEEAAGWSVRSTENGGYLIPGVSPGSYRLAARAVIHNRVHRTELPVEVTVGPQRTMRVDVTLP